MTGALPDEFRETPIAHRGLHDINDGRPENSRAAVQAALDAGYGIEIDVQLTSDEQALVFHDYDLKRLTGVTGAVRQRTAVDLAATRLRHGDEGIPTLSDILAMVGGQVPLLIEVKDQDGALGPSVGPLETAVADALKGYPGNVAVMSFNPHSVAKMQDLAPDLPRGLVTDAFRAETWPVPKARLSELRDIPDFACVGASFISHDCRDLDRARVAELREGGATILCWTVRSEEAEAKAREIAHNITFESYLP